MTRYYLRCIETDYSTMIALGVKLGMIQVDEEENISAIDGAWDYIGHIPKATGEVITDEEGFEYPVTAPKADADGNPYIHVNMVSELSMWEQAAALGDDPEITSIMGDLRRFFVLDAEGNPHVPTTPYRVFAGV